MAKSDFPPVVQLMTDLQSVEFAGGAPAPVRGAGNAGALGAQAGLSLRPAASPQHLHRYRFLDGRNRSVEALADHLLALGPQRLGVLRIERIGAYPVAQD
jgi:hypothetical protein